MSKLTFVVGIKRRKIDEYRPEALSYDHRYRSGTDRFCRADCCTALIYPEGELSSSFLISFLIVIKFAINFCHFVYFCFFVIDVMLLTSAFALSQRDGLPESLHENQFPSAGTGYWGIWHRYH
jgi:hypothetical protein